MSHRCLQTVLGTFNYKSEYPFDATQPQNVVIPEHIDVAVTISIVNTEFGSTSPLEMNDTVWWCELVSAGMRWQRWAVDLNARHGKGVSLLDHWRVFQQPDSPIELGTVVTDSVNRSHRDGQREFKTCEI
jgi:hypothetical protein